MGQQIHASVEYFTPGDLAPLVERIEASAVPHAIGAPWFLEPEPNEMKKRRFRSDVEVPTGYQATFSFTGPGHRNAGEPIFGNIVFDHPRGAAVPSGGLPVDPHWLIDDQYPGDGVLVTSENVGATPAPVLGQMAVDVLVALGAPLPTGRWRISEFWIEYHNYEI